MIPLFLNNSAPTLLPFSYSAVFALGIVVMRVVNRAMKPRKVFDQNSSAEERCIMLLSTDYRPKHSAAVSHTALCAFVTAENNKMASLRWHSRLHTDHFYAVVRVVCNQCNYEHGWRRHTKLYDIFSVFATVDQSCSQGGECTCQDYRLEVFMVQTK